MIWKLKECKEWKTHLVVRSKNNYVRVNVTSFTATKSKRNSIFLITAIVINSLKCDSIQIE